MFTIENLEEIMRPDKYLYILDRNCEQFEPDNPLYIATAKAVYEHINLNTAYDTLWSTRHFGPMVFHLVWEKKCDDLIGIKNEILCLQTLCFYLSQARELCSLYIIFSMVSNKTER